MLSSSQIDQMEKVNLFLARGKRRGVINDRLLLLAVRINKVIALDAGLPNLCHAFVGTSPAEFGNRCAGAVCT